VLQLCCLAGKLGGRWCKQDKQRRGCRRKLGRPPDCNTFTSTPSPSLTRNSGWTHQLRESDIRQDSQKRNSCILDDDIRRLWGSRLYEGVRRHVPCFCVSFFNRYDLFFSKRTFAYVSMEQTHNVQLETIMNVRLVYGRTYPCEDYK
jgi:hypothetical protein